MLAIFLHTDLLSRNYFSPQCRFPTAYRQTSPRALERTFGPSNVHDIPFVPRSFSQILHKQNKRSQLVPSHQSSLAHVNLIEC